jgi:hypothetical protein
VFGADVKATAEESCRPLPGDKFLADPAVTIMNAVTIAAQPAQVWPWLAQLGSGRGGWYAYDFVDNDGHPSAKTILAGLQKIAVGDVLPSLPGATDSFVVAALHPAEDLVLAVPSADGGFGVSWEFFLAPSSQHCTRLLVRGRVAANWPSGSAGTRKPSGRRRPIELVYALLGRIPRGVMMPLALFGHGLMQARQLRGIKRRAESLQAPSRLAA